MTSERRGLINCLYVEHLMPDDQDNLPNCIIEVRLCSRLDIGSNPVVVIPALARH